MSGDELTVPDLLRLRCGRGSPGPVAADLHNAFWRMVEPVSLRENVTGGVPNQTTRVRTAWNGAEWRILFEMDDAHPWATLTTHDAPLWTEEVVEVFVDPVGDLESYFEIEINPLGAVADVVLRRVVSGWRKDFGWHAEGLQSHVRRTDTGWAAELAIPFAALQPSSPTLGMVWRVNFLRIDRAEGPDTEAELSAWSPTGIRNFHRPDHFGRVEFIEEPSSIQNRT